MNSLINIITKKTGETRGALVVAAAAISTRDLARCSRTSFEMTGPIERRRARLPRLRRPGLSASLAKFVLAICIGVSSGMPAPARGQSSGASEYDVKAAFLFHFAQFVEWPPDTFKDVDTPLTYCTIGEDPFHGALDESVRGKTVGNRPLRVQHLKAQEQIAGCQVLFIAAREKKWEGDALASANGHPVLTVGESEHFVQGGGVIGFFLEENKVRFEINLEAAGKARLKISAKLLTLAKTVLGSPRGA